MSLISLKDIIEGVRALRKGKPPEKTVAPPSPPPQPLGAPGGLNGISLTGTTSQSLQTEPSPESIYEMLNGSSINISGSDTEAYTVRPVIPHQGEEFSRRRQRFLDGSMHSWCERIRTAVDFFLNRDTSRGLARIEHFMQNKRYHLNRCQDCRDRVRWMESQQSAIMWVRRIEVPGGPATAFWFQHYESDPPASGSF